MHYSPRMLCGESLQNFESSAAMIRWQATGVTRRFLVRTSAHKFQFLPSLGAAPTA